MIGMEFSRAFGNKRAALCVLGVAAVYIVSALVEQFPGADSLYLFTIAYDLGKFNRLMWCLCALPHAMSYCLDVNGGVMRECVIRAGIRRYALSKALACWVSAGVCAALGLAIFILWLRLFFPAIGSDGTSIALIDGAPFSSLAGNGKLNLYFLCYILIVMLTAGLYSTIALFISTYIRNPLTVFFIPFIADFTIKTFQAAWWPEEMSLRLLFLGYVKIVNIPVTLLYTIGLLGGSAAILSFAFCRRVRGRLLCGA